MENLLLTSLDDVITFPNPCYPDKGHRVKIANIPLNSSPTIYIYSIAGELVRVLDDNNDEILNSMTAIWDARNEHSRDVVSGIYIYLLKCDKGTKQGKIAIIR
ncbi:MAG: T9SS type A sorting domain-containing protein [bacterium]|nr:T9SS type A sorting domain-containing protein [bacterium]